MVGLPVAGKTGAARRAGIEQEALRIVEVGLHVLEFGGNVAIGYGSWVVTERSALRQAAADRGARVQMHYFKVSPAEQ